jgi:isopentenyldiphosphate isomerase
MSEFWDILDKNGKKTDRLHERGKPMKKGEYHLIVHVWIINNKNEFLISRRALNDEWCSGMWQTTGGCAIAGDDGLTAALRETEEEIGIFLDPQKAQLFKQYTEPHSDDEGGILFNIWLFKQDVDIAAISLHPEETCDAMWAMKDKIKQMIDDGDFISPSVAYPYLYDLFEFCNA